MPASPALRAAYIAAMQADASAEYRVQSQGAEIRAQNPGHRLSAVAVKGHAGLHLQAAGATGARGEDSRKLDLALSGFGCEGQVGEVGGATLQARENRVEFQRPGLTEWYVNGPLGVEQGFTVSSRPRCDSGRGSDLRFEVSVGEGITPSLHGSGDAAESYVELADAAGGRWLRYSDVFAKDASGRALPTRLAVNNGRIEISVDDDGAQYPITVDPLVWTLDQQLLGSDTAANDLFGRALAITGTTAVVGAWQATVSGKSGAGAAYVFVRSGTTWGEQAKLVASDGAADDAFGYSVAVSGNTAVIGSVAATVGGKSAAGAAYVFVRSGTAWTQQAKLSAADAAADDSFAESVAIDGDTVLVGAPYADIMGDGDRGAVYVYGRSGTTWTQQAKLAPSDGVGGDHAGQSVAIAGNTALFGAPFADVAGQSSAGAAYVYLRAGMTWSLQQKLSASDAASTDGFGGAVALVSDTAIVGADQADVGGRANAGAAYVFARTGTTWNEQQKLSATTAIIDEGFGIAVALASTSSTAIVGADGNSRGGAAYVFGRSGTTWTQQQQLISPLVGADGNFGRGVGIDGDLALVGAPFSNLPGKLSAGAVIGFALSMTKGNGQTCVSAVECTSGFCADGVCCASACGGGAADCQVCSVAAGGTTNGTCTMAKMGSTCRAAGSVCDVAETCDGVSGSCPADAFKPATTECRTASGACDVAEYCTGSSATCPSDNLKPSGAECRASVGACDIAEKCNGTSILCPTDSFKTNTTECRSAAGICDVGEYCTGTGPACPSDSFKAKTTTCRAAAGACDAVEFCSGTGAACPSDAFLPKTSECRAAAGACDVAETCTGMASDCPTDTFKPKTSMCRSATDVCDAAEFCSGGEADCPTDGFKAAGTECRAVAGACDAAESCTGFSPGCPKDTFKPAATVCRPVSGECDVEEACTGMAAACPSDGFVAAGTSCAGGTCRAGQCRAEAELSLQLVPPTATTRGLMPVSFLLSVRNASDTPASAVRVRIDIPEGASVQSVTGDGWACTSMGTGATCERQRLDKGVSPALAASIVPPRAVPAFAIVAQVSAAEYDPMTENNQATAQITNEAPAKDGGCSVTPGQAPSGSRGMLWLGLLLAGLVVRRSRRSRSAAAAL
jgi:MYXO-CTERM domain-containing protein